MQFGQETRILHALGKVAPSVARPRPLERGQGAFHAPQIGPDRGRPSAYRIGAVATVVRPTAAQHSTPRVLRPSSRRDEAIDSSMLVAIGLSFFLIRPDAVSASKPGNEQANALEELKVQVRLLR